MQQAIQLFSDSNRGVYIPKHFAEEIKREYVKGIGEGELSILECGPDNALYWQTWEYVLDHCRIVIDGQTFQLHQDGDLWLVDHDNATPDELINLLGDE